MKEKEVNSMLVLVLVNGISYNGFSQDVKSSMIDKCELLILKEMDKELIYVSLPLKILGYRLKIITHKIGHNIYWINFSRVMILM